MRIFFLGIFFVLMSFSLVPQTSLAQGSTPCKSGDEYCLLAPLPITSPSGGVNDKTNPSEYIRGIVNLAVAAAGVIAVLKLVFAGFQYITTENFMGKSSAKGDINNALIGLLLAIGAFTILQTINPRLVELGITIDDVSSSSSITPPELCTTALVDGKCPTGSSDAISVGCTNDCVNVTAFKFSSGHAKPPGGDCTVNGTCRGSGCQGNACFVTRSLGSQLDSMTQTLADAGITQWQVSEMFPSTVTHLDDCHKPNTSQSGTCVDVVFGSAENNTVMGKILKGVSAVFPSFVYEVCPKDSKRLADLKAAFPQYASHFDCKSTTTGENMHINMSGGSRSF